MTRVPRESWEFWLQLFHLNVGIPGRCITTSGEYLAKSSLTGDEGKHPGEIRKCHQATRCRKEQWSTTHLML